MMNPMQLAQMLQQSNNPMGLLSMMAGSNPMLHRALEMGQGKSPEQLRAVAENLARQRGVDLNQFMHQFGF